MIFTLVFFSVSLLFAQLDSNPPPQQNSDSLLAPTPALLQDSLNSSSLSSLDSSAPNQRTPLESLNPLDSLDSDNHPPIDSTGQALPIDSLEVTKLNPLDTLLPAFHLAIFLNTELRFINFEEREYFQEVLDSTYREKRRDSVNITQGVSVRTDPFERVDMTLPLLAGLQWRVNEHLRVLLSTGYLYHSAEGLVTEGSRSEKFRYQFELFPLQAEVQVNIPLSLLSEDEIPQLFMAFRYHSSYQKSILRFQDKKALGESGWQGNGWGMTFGGRHGVWRFIELESYIGLDYIQIPFDKNWEDLLPPQEVKAKTPRQVKPELNAFFLGGRLLLHLF